MAAAGTKSSVEKPEAQQNGNGEPESNGALFEVDVEKASNGNHVEVDVSTVDGEPEASDPGPDHADESVKTFTFTPKDGESFEVPKVGVAIPYDRQRWFFWKLRKLVGLEQPIFWLDQAGVPDGIQEQIMLMDDSEWARFFEEWMADGSGASLGE